MVIDYILFYYYLWRRGKYRYSWKQFDYDTYCIFAWARYKDFKNVYGVPRGGLGLAVKLSHLLGRPQILLKSEVDANTLVVDDICDNGDRIAELEDWWAKRGFTPKIATIFYKEGVKRRPDFFVRRKKVSWIWFPWETEEGSKYNCTKIP